MKKTLVSLATASLIASSAMAADKGVDFTTTGQAVLYYQTSNAGAADLFDAGSTNTKANVGVQLNIGADLGNNFTFGSQLSFLGTAGLEKNLVSNTAQDAGQSLTADTTAQLMLTQISIAKKVANTTVKIGRQELPKSLSPLAFSEGWDVFKNTFDAILVVNSDLPDTTVVAAYVGGSTGMNLSTVGNLATNAGDVNGAAYMLTVQNKSAGIATVTGSYYHLQNVSAAGLGADALWLDVAVADKSLPMGLKVGIQAGSISADTVKTTNAFGLKVGAKPMDALTVCAAYTSVNDGTVAVRNTGSVKTPLYTQMVANQGKIELDNDTFKGKIAYSLGDMGTVIAQGSYTSATADSVEADVLYKVKAGGVNFLAAYVYSKTENADHSDIIRVVARYAF